jgi:hypothetical protein
MSAPVGSVAAPIRVGPGPDEEVLDYGEDRRGFLEYGEVARFWRHEHSRAGESGSELHPVAMDLELSAVALGEHTEGALVTGRDGGDGGGLTGPPPRWHRRRSSSNRPRAPTGCCRPGPWTRRCRAAGRGRCHARCPYRRVEAVVRLEAQAPGGQLVDGGLDVVHHEVPHALLELHLIGAKVLIYPRAEHIAATGESLNIASSSP